VEALIIGTAAEADSSRAELTTGDISWGLAAWLTVGAKDGIMWFGAPGSVLSGALGTCVDPEATLESSTGACTSIMTEPCCSCTCISGNGKADIVGSLDSLVKILSLE
jgi:hypothetical protein